MTKEDFLIFLLTEDKNKGNLYEVVNLLSDKGYSKDKIRDLYKDARNHNWIKNTSNKDDICCPFEFTEQGKDKATVIYDESNKNIFLKANDFLKGYRYILSIIILPILGLLVGKYGEIIWNYLVN